VPFDFDEIVVMGNHTLDFIVEYGAVHQNQISTAEAADFDIGTQSDNLEKFRMA
jgi:hypothetical protein